MRRRILFPMLALLAASLPAGAATPLPEYAWLRTASNLGSLGTLDLAALAPSETRLSTLGADGFGYVDLLVSSTIHLYADGSVSEHITQVRRFLTSAGIEQGGNMGFVVAPQYETATIEQALVANPDGTLPLDPATLQVVPREEPRVFSDAREVIAPFPGLRPGSTAVLVVEQRVTTPDFLRPWSAGILLSGIVPVERFEAIVTWDAGAAAPRWASTDPAMQCRPDGDRRLVCRLGPIAAFALDPDLNDFFDLMPQLVITQAQSWNELADNIRAAVERQARGADVRDMAAHLTATAHTPRQRLDAIYRFVADQIRYVGIEKGSGAIVPRPPDVTLHNRFGDCKDKVVLFLALARAAGLDAHAVLTATDRHEVPNLVLPNGGYFNHMIACVRGIDGQEVCVDPTLPNVPAGELGSALQGAVALDLLPGTAAPRQLPAGRFMLQIDVDSQMHIACDGSIKETLRRAYSGSSALNFRINLDGRRPDERRRWLEEEYRAAIRSGVMPTFTVAGLDVPAAQLEVRSETSFPPGRPLRDVDGYQDSDAWLSVYGMAMRSENRHHPFRHGGLRYASTLHFDLCSDVTAHFLGAELDLRSPFGTLQRSYERASSGVTVHTTLEIPAATVPIDQLPRFNKFLERALRQSGIWFSLTSAS